MENKFAEKIAEAIRNSPLTQKEIARCLKISAGNLTNWKRGENLPSIEMLYRLCIVLDESADYLLGLEDEAGTNRFFAADYLAGNKKNK